MSQFLRALRLTLRYRWTLTGTFLCSLVVAVLWGGNIGALYPVFEVVLRGRSMQAWVEEESQKCTSRMQQLQGERAGLEQQRATASGSQRTKFEKLLAANRAQFAIEQAALQRFTFLKPFINRCLPDDPFQTVVVIVLALMVATALKDAFLVGNIVLSARLNQSVTVDLQKQFFAQALRMDPVVFGQRGAAQMMGHMNTDIAGVANGLNQLFGGAIREPMKIVACFIGAAIISWRLLLFSMLLVPLAAFSMRLLAASIRRASHRALKEGVALNQVIYEVFCGLPTVQAFTMEQHEQRRFDSKAIDCMRRTMRIVFYNALTKPVTEVLGLSIVCLTLVAGAHLVLNDATHIFGIRLCNRQMELPELLVFYGLLVGMSDPARKLSEIFGAVQGGVAAAERLYPILDITPRISDPPQPAPAPRPHQRLIFEHVSFAYTAEQPVLKDISIEIRYGESVAIVGPNGCGKSTLVNLIPRFFDPTEGSIRLDNSDLRHLALADLRGLVGVVSQQHQLFNDSVLNNIRYGCPGATREQVIEAARQAHAHRFIETQLEHGYDSEVGEAGGRLSGGQRQRIALARAILRNPDILILDEATSQVDLESEQLIHKALEHFMRDRTAIVITHRLSTLSLCDRILVMDGGRILDCGNHDELMRRCDVYRRLHEIHFRKTA